MSNACDLIEELRDLKKTTLEKSSAEYNNASHNQPRFKFTNYSRHNLGRPG